MDSEEPEHTGKTFKIEADVCKSIDNYWKRAYNYITIEKLYTMLLNNEDPEGYLFNRI